MHSLGVIIGHNFKNHRVNVGRAQIIVLVFCQNDGLSHVPTFQLVGAGSHRMAEEVRLLHVLPLQQVGRQHRHGHILQKGHIGFCQAEGDGLVIHHSNLLHVLIVGSVFRTVVRVHNGFDGKLHILGCKRLAVMPVNAVPDVEGVGISGLVIVPGLCQTGYHLIVAVVGRQAVEQQNVDFAMLIHGRVDTGVVAGAVDQCSSFFCLHLSSIFVTAGGQQHGHGQRKHH